MQYIKRILGPFHVLVGSNVSGKTAFLDVVGFLQDLVSDGLEAALSNRTTNPQELLFRRQGDCLELAIEARVPDDLRERTVKPEMDTARYEVAIGFDETQRQFEFKSEKFMLNSLAIRQASPPTRVTGFRPDGSNLPWVIARLRQE